MRVVVIGTTGAGKSTFADTLAARLSCPCFDLDALFWGPQWTPVPTDVFTDRVRAAAAGDAWVAAGNYSVIRDVLWPRATHIVWLNYSRTVIFPRLFMRTMRRLVRRTPLWEGNRESVRGTFWSRDSILLYGITSFERNRQRFTALAMDPRYSHARWFVLTVPAEANRVLAALQHADQST
jgi:adenylate kinase family enzyme